MMLGDVNELVIRYVDQEMRDDEIRAFEAMLNARPELQLLVAQHKALRANLIDAWGEAPGEAGLESIHQLLETPPDTMAHSTMARPTRLIQRFQNARRFWPIPAMAASLALGVMVGNVTHVFPSEALMQMENGQLMATGALDSALTRRLASQTDQAPVNIHLSFRTQDGVCRSFSMTGGTAGLACRHSGRWRVESIMQQQAASRQSEYRLAASSVPPALMAQVDTMILGEPLSPDEESREIAQSWSEPK